MESRLVEITTTTTNTMTLLETHLGSTSIATRNTRPCLDTNIPRKVPHRISHSTVSMEQIANFVGSSSTWMSKLPKSPSLVELTAEIVSSLYLSLQINAIEEYVIDLSSGAESHYVAPLDLYHQPIQVDFVEQASITDHLVMHQQAVHETLQIQSALRSPDTNISIQVGAWKMSNLSLLLGTLGMYKEAARICGWAIRIFRTFARIDREAYYTQHLVHNLRLLSWLYYKDHELEAAHGAITESVNIGWSLHMPTLLVRERSRSQLSRSLRCSAEILAVMGEDTRAFLNAGEAVRVLEELFSDHLSQEIPTESGFILREFKWNELVRIVERETIFDYARALAMLSSTLHTLQFPTATIKVATKSLEIFYFISHLYPEGFCQPDTEGLLEYISELEKTLPSSSQKAVLSNCLPNSH